MPLFEVAVIEKPTQKDREAGAVELLKFGPTAVIANDINSARYVAVTEAAGTLDLARAEVLVRPFV